MATRDILIDGETGQPIEVPPVRKPDNTGRNVAIGAGVGLLLLLLLRKSGDGAGTAGLLTTAKDRKRMFVLRPNGLLYGKDGGAHDPAVIAAESVRDPSDIILTVTGDTVSSVRDRVLRVLLSTASVWIQDPSAPNGYRRIEKGVAA